MSHVYFAAYIPGFGTTTQEIKACNRKILSNAISALETLCPELEFVTLQTGGKYYGVEFPEHLTFTVPFKESMPRIPEPYASDVFYYAQIDVMREMCKGKKWQWADIRPDAIIGFVPNNNAMNLSQPLAVFLSLYREVHGQGAEVSFPGSEASFKAKHTDTSQDILARFTIYASLHSDKTAGKAFNIGNADECVSWSSVWPGICEYFGLVGKGPDPSQASPDGGEWVKKHQCQWDDLVKKNGLKEKTVQRSSWDFMAWLTQRSGFDRQYDLELIRSVGFLEQIDTVKGYHIAFQRMREAKVIP